MTKNILLAPLAALLTAAPISAQEAEKEEYPSPNAIVAAAPASDWKAIAASDLLVMDIAPDEKGEARRVIIQLMPAPFSQGWIRNIRKLAAAKFWDGTSINRVQDNYVVQWGDAGYDNPESGETDQKALPEDLEVVPESEYESSVIAMMLAQFNEEPTQEKVAEWKDTLEEMADYDPFLDDENNPDRVSTRTAKAPSGWHDRDSYAEYVAFYQSWPLGMEAEKSKQIYWPIHCYGAVGVGRNLSPDTGTGAELYTVIGQAPRHLDRNIAVVGRIIEGIEHLSSLPRGKGQLGFYADASKRVPILSIRLGTALDSENQLKFEQLDSEKYYVQKPSIFRQYIDARANRRDPFFIKPAGGADICNIPVPVRRVAVD